MTFTDEQLLELTFRPEACMYLLNYIDEPKLETLLVIPALRHTLFDILLEKLQHSKIFNTESKVYKLCLQYIDTDPTMAIKYVLSQNTIKRHKNLEKCILTSAVSTLMYMRKVPGLSRWKEGLAKLQLNKESLSSYIYDGRYRSRLLELEDKILELAPVVTFNYIWRTSKGRWSAFEEKLLQDILPNARVIQAYIEEIVCTRWFELEQQLLAIHPKCSELFSCYSSKIFDLRNGLITLERKMEL